jgi:hypothetical protein
MKKIIIAILVLFVIWVVAFNIKSKRDMQNLDNVNTAIQNPVIVEPVTNTDTTIKNTTNTTTGTKTSGSGVGTYTTGTGTKTSGPGGLKSGDVLIPSGSNGFAPGPCPDKAMC